MAKRFSWREFGLLLAPVLAIGAVGLWASKRRPRVVAGPPLSFIIDRPTTLEAFKGAQGAIVMSYGQPGEGLIQSASPFFELHTSHGVTTAPEQGATKKIWGPIWKGGSRLNNRSRWAIDFNRIPPGDLIFGCETTVMPFSHRTPGPLFRASARQALDRTKVQALGISSWPRKPHISLRDMKISVPGTSYMAIQGVFHLENLDMKTNDQVPLEASLSVPGYSHIDMVDLPPKTLKMPQQRILRWFIDSPTTSSSKARITGRVSAGNRWPLGFEIEPFDFKTAKAGQKLKFKQGPVALPKG